MTKILSQKNTFALPDDLTMEQIKSLPQLKVNGGGSQTIVRYDYQRKLMFMFDTNDRLVKFCKADIPPAVQENGLDMQQENDSKTEAADAPPESVRAENNPTASNDNQPQPINNAEAPDGEAGEANSAPPDDSNQEKEVNNSEDNEDQKEEHSEKGNHKKTLWKLLIGTIAACIVLVTAYVFVMRGNTPTGETGSTMAETEATLETEQPTEETKKKTTEPTSSVIQVLQAKSMMLPGHVIEADDFEPKDIPDTEYKTLTVSGGIYTTNELEKLEGLVVNTYIPIGKYLSYSDVSSSYSPSNPWGRTDDRQNLITFSVKTTPEDLPTYMIGNYVDIQITVRTSVSAPMTNAGATDATAPDSVNHQSTKIETTMVDTYRISAPIVDLLSHDKTSLFPKYKSLSSIPMPFQYEEIEKMYPDAKALEEDLPYYIVVAVPVEQASVFEVINPNNISIEVENPTQFTSTELQTVTYTAFQELANTYAELWDSLQSGE